MGREFLFFETRKQAKQVVEIQEPKGQREPNRVHRLDEINLIIRARLPKRVIGLPIVRVRRFYIVNKSRKLVVLLTHWPKEPGEDAIVTKVELER